MKVVGSLIILAPGIVALLIVLVLIIIVIIIAPIAIFSIIVIVVPLVIRFLFSFRAICKPFVTALFASTRTKALVVLSFYRVASASELILK